MRGVLAGVAVVAVSTAAHAHGPDPHLTSITFQRGNDQHVVAGTTFGMLASHDGGTTWQWTCEAAVGYGGTFDPDYAYPASGALFATTFDGLRVRQPQDACAFASTPAGAAFVARVEDSANALYYAASGTRDSSIYRSTDNGTSFPTSASPGAPGDWWSSLVVAPSNPQRLYLTGYRIDAMVKQLLVFTSTDGGVSFAPMLLTGVTPISQSSSIEIVGIDPSDERIVYAKVTVEDGELGDSIYRSTDAGQTWTKILTRRSIYGLSFLVRDDGTCVAGTRELGAWRSADCASAAAPAWSMLAGAPSVACLVEDPAGTVWACTQNSTYTPMPPAPPVPGDGFAIMRSADLATWTGLLRLQDIAEPVPCPLGTPQRDLCVEPTTTTASPWCCLVQQLGITSTAVDCSGAYACNGPSGVDGATDAGVKDLDPPERPCCGTSDPRSSALLSLIVALTLRVRRRRR